jgi:hypothetical protein
MTVKAGGKPLRFAGPVHADGGGGDYQRGALVAAGEDEGDRLQRFAQTHVVGQTGPDAPVGQPGQPGKALMLVIAQLCLQGLGNRGSMDWAVLMRWRCCFQALSTLSWATSSTMSSRARAASP